MSNESQTVCALANSVPQLCMQGRRLQQSQIGQQRSPMRWASKRQISDRSSHPKNAR